MSALITDIGSVAEASLESGYDMMDGGFYDHVLDLYGDRFRIFFEFLASSQMTPTLAAKIGRLHEELLQRISSQLLRKHPEGLPSKRDPYILANAMLSLFIGLQVRSKLGLSPRAGKRNLVDGNEGDM